MEIKTGNYEKEGLYILCNNGDFLDFSKERIKQLGDEYWNNPSKIPPHIRENDDFKTCTVCPYRGQNVFCSAMKPLLPFIGNMDKFVSYNDVTAIYVNQNGLIHVSDTTIQDALQYVTNMALFEYCEDAKGYRKYWKGITPLIKLKEAACQIFLNIYWLNKGNREKVNETIEEMRDAITYTTTSCVKRLNVMCKSDAFTNAFVKTQLYAEVLFMDIDDKLEKYYKGEL